jgi:hypothetical protein
MAARARVLSAADSNWENVNKVYRYRRPSVHRMSVLHCAYVTAKGQLQRHLCPRSCLQSSWPHEVPLTPFRAWCPESWTVVDPGDGYCQTCSWKERFLFPQCNNTESNSFRGMFWYEVEMWNRMAGIKSRVHEWQKDCFALRDLAGTATILTSPKARVMHVIIFLPSFGRRMKLIA